MLTIRFHKQLCGSVGTAARFLCDTAHYLAIIIQTKAHYWKGNGFDFNTLLGICVKRLPHTFIYNPTMTELLR